MEIVVGVETPQYLITSIASEIVEKSAELPPTVYTLFIVVLQPKAVDLIVSFSGLPSIFPLRRVVYISMLFTPAKGVK